MAIPYTCPQDEYEPLVEELRQLGVRNGSHPSHALAIRQIQAGWDKRDPDSKQFTFQTTQSTDWHVYTALRNIRRDD